MSKKYNITKDFLHKEYTINKKSISQIAKEMGCSITPIYNKLIKYNIPIRNNKYSKILTKQFLDKEYIINKKSCAEIAEEIGCYYETIRLYLIKYSILLRTQSEAMKGKYLGYKNGNYTDGRYSKQHYCIDCLKKNIKTEITYQTWKYGNNRCYSCANKRKWQNKEFREKTIKAMFESMLITPNKPEQLLIKLLNNLLPKTYKFVGDGKLIVGGFVPDFVNKNNNKIIEMYGTYWHNREDWSKRDKRRLIAYKKHGYKTLIIWEHELKNLDKVKNRIKEFSTK